MLFYAPFFGPLLVKQSRTVSSIKHSYSLDWNYKLANCNLLFIWTFLYLGGAVLCIYYHIATQAEVLKIIQKCLVLRYTNTVYNVLD